MRAILTSLVIAAGLSLSTPGWADEAPLADARSMLLSGQYDAAISMGETMGTAESLALAAESISAKVMLGYVDDAKDESKRARKIASKALELDPESHEAHVQFALAYGFETQSSSPFRAWRKNLPEKTLSAITELRTKFPDDPRGDALLGAWHLGIVRKAGEKRARKMFDAYEADGIAHYQAALEKSPKDIIIMSNFTAVLLSIDAERHLSTVLPLLEKIEDCPPQNVVEAEVQTRVAQLPKHIDNPEKLMELANMILEGHKTY